jgi:hypothetical protein
MYGYECRTELRRWPAAPVARRAHGPARQPAAPESIRVAHTLSAWALPRRRRKAALRRTINLRPPCPARLNTDHIASACPTCIACTHVHTIQPPCASRPAYLLFQRPLQPRVSLPGLAELPIHALLGLRSGRARPPPDSCTPSNTRTRYALPVCAAACTTRWHGDMACAVAVAAWRSLCQQWSVRRLTCCSAADSSWNLHSCHATTQDACMSGACDP